MEGLGVDSRGALWPCLATDTCANKDPIVLVLRDASRETRTGAFEFMREVCLSVALAISYFFDSCGLPTNNDSFAARQLAGRAARTVLACSKRSKAAGGQGRWPYVLAWLEVARQSRGKPRLL